MVIESFNKPRLGSAEDSRTTDSGGNLLQLLRINQHVKFKLYISTRVSKALADFDLTQGNLGRAQHMLYLK